MIYHVVVDSVMEGALGIGLDVVDTAARLHRAGLVKLASQGSSLSQRVVSIDGRPVKSVQHRQINVDGVLSIRKLRAGDVLVLPGIFATKDTSIDRLFSRDDVLEVVSLIGRAAKKGVLIAASCSATFLVASSGLLDNKCATTTWWLMPFFARRFPKVTLTADRMVVDSGKVITAGSAFAHADLMLNLVSRLASPALASLSSKYLVLDSRASHSRYMVIDHLRRADPVLQSLEGYVMQNIDRQISLGELARKLAVSQRTLARKVESASGMTPIEFVHRVRISHAVHLLETTKKPVDEIATLVGYADSSAFRKIFRRYAGDTPKARRFPT